MTGIPSHYSFNNDLNWESDPFIVLISRGKRVQKSGLWVPNASALSVWHSQSFLLDLEWDTGFHLQTLSLWGCWSSSLFQHQGAFFLLFWKHWPFVEFSSSLLGHQPKFTEPLVVIKVFHPVQSSCKGPHRPFNWHHFGVGYICLP